ncbi:MAG: DNA repair exonuclease, partial [Acidithiobacillus ferrivorans]
YEGAPVDDVRGATRLAFENLIATALRERVDLVVIGGDLYDGDWPDHNTGLFFVKGVTQLAEEGIPVAIVRGNHDAASKLTKSLRLPRNVHLLADAKPETVVLDQIGVAIHGQSFVTPAVLDDLASAYPAPIPDCFNIGLLHTSLNGRPGHDNYAPTTLSVLQGKGYDYWALGHVHEYAVLQEDPWLVFPGNLQGRHIRETGAHGAVMVTADEAGIHSVERLLVDSLRWHLVEVDAADAITLEDVVRQVGRAFEQLVAATPDKIYLSVRVLIKGKTAAHGELFGLESHLREEIIGQAAGQGIDRMWVEKVRIETEPVTDAVEIAARSDAIADLQGFLD